MISYTAEDFCKRVQSAFATNPELMNSVGGDGALNGDFKEAFKGREFKHAAVLVPVIDMGDETTVLLTQRTENLSSHKGQIAFPGGKIDLGETQEEAALREAEEEVGLRSQDVQLLGTLGHYYSGSGYCISPVLGLIRGRPALQINPDEVADAFEVPLNFLMDRTNHKIESLQWKNKDRHFYAMPYQDTSVSPSVERRIWGVTAGIIRMVQERVYHQ